MKWTADRDLLLLLKLIETHGVPVFKADRIQEAWPLTDGEIPSVRAIKERIRFLRNSAGIKKESRATTNFSSDTKQGRTKRQQQVKPGKEPWQVRLEDDEEEMEKEMKKTIIKQEEGEASETSKPWEITTPIAVPNSSPRKGKAQGNGAGLKSWEETSISAGAVAERIKRKRGGDKAERGAGENDDSGDEEEEEETMPE